MIAERYKPNMEGYAQPETVACGASILPLVQYVADNNSKEVQNFLMVRGYSDGKETSTDALAYRLQQYIVDNDEEGAVEVFRELHPDYHTIKEVANVGNSKDTPATVVLPHDKNSFDWMAFFGMQQNNQQLAKKCKDDDIVCQIKDFFTIKINIITALALVIIAYIIYRAFFRDNK